MTRATVAGLTIVFCALTLAPANPTNLKGQEATLTDVGSSVVPSRETRTLKGEIIDHRSSTPIVGAVVNLPALHRTTGSDAAGTFQFANLPAARYIIQIRRLGYAPDSIVVDLSDSSRSIVIRIRSTALELSSLTVSTERDKPPGQSFKPASVLEGAALDRHLGSSIAATISSQPGVTQRYNGPMAAQPVIRGLTGDRVLVLEDGLRTGDIATTSSDHSVTIDPLTARRIEVVRGPAGLIYGTNTLGGVVNVVRGDIPHARPEHHNITLGSQLESVNRSGTLLGEAIIPLPYNLTARAEFTGRKGGDTRTPAGPLPFTNLHAMDASAGMSWIGYNTLFGMSFREYQAYYGVPSSFDGTTLPGSHTGGVYVDLRRSTGRMEGEYRSEDANTFIRSVRGMANYVRFEQEELELGGFVGTRFGQLAASGDVVARYERGRHSGAIGAFAQWRDFRAIGSYTGTRPAELKSQAVFGFHEVDLSPIRLMAGLRYDRLHYTPLDSTPSPFLPEVGSRTFASFTWTVGATYAITSDLTAGVNIARAFRAPAIEELYSSGPHLASYSYEIGNPDLNAEFGFGADAFLRYTHERATAEISVFNNDIRDFIRYAPMLDSETGFPIRDPRIRRYIVYQAGQENARLNGIEGSLQFEIRPGLALDAVASTLRGTSKSGSPLPAMPPARINLGLRHDRSLWFVGGNIESMFSQSRIPPAPVANSECVLDPAMGADSLRPAEFCTTPGTVLFNAVAGLRLTTNNILHTITISLDNVFNREWRDPLWRAKQVAPQPGRNIRVLYRVRY